MPVVERLALDDGPDALHPGTLLLGVLFGCDGRLLLVSDRDLFARIRSCCGR